MYQRARPVRRPQESASSRSISAGIISLLISALISARWHVLLAGGGPLGRTCAASAQRDTVTRYRTPCVRDAGTGRRHRSRETGGLYGTRPRVQIIKKSAHPPDPQRPGSIGRQRARRGPRVLGARFVVVELPDIAVPRLRHGLAPHGAHAQSAELHRRFVADHHHTFRPFTVPRSRSCWSFCAPKMENQVGVGVVCESEMRPPHTLPLTLESKLA